MHSESQLALSRLESQLVVDGECPPHVWNPADPGSFRPRYREDFVPPSAGGPRDPQTYTMTQLLSWRLSSFRLFDPDEPVRGNPNFIENLPWHRDMTEACNALWGPWPDAANFPILQR